VKIGSNKIRLGPDSGGILKLSKRILIFSILMVYFYSSGSSAHAQNKRFIAGSMVGFYGIHIQGDIREMYSSTNGIIWGTGGYSFGLNVKRYFGNSFYGGLELRYMRKGSLFEFITSHGTQGFESIKLDYIEIPLVAGIVLQLKRKYLLIESGIAYARLFKARMLVNDFNQWDPSPKINQLKKNDFPLVVNLKYPVTHDGKLLLGFRFSYSLSSIHSYYQLYNMNYGVELYYLFNKEKEELRGKPE
jgi:hypothetical protein